MTCIYDTNGDGDCAKCYNCGGCEAVGGPFIRRETMKQFVAIECAAGKTIDKVVSKWDELFIVFTDDTYTHIEVDHDFENGSTTLSVSELTCGSLFNTTCVDLGIVTEEEVYNYRNAQAKALQQSKDAEDWDMYVKLKEKFDKKTEERRQRALNADNAYTEEK